MARKKTCKNCGVRYEKKETDKPFQNWCSDDCQYQLAIDKLNKNRKKALAKAKAKKKEERKAITKKKAEFNRNDLSWQHDQTQKAFNKMRKLEEFYWFLSRGLEPVCISCNRPNMDWCAGHFKTRGAYPELRYDRKNVYLQCNFRCNSNLSGNIEGNKHTRGYKTGLRERFGVDDGQDIIDYCEAFKEPIQYTCEMLEEMRKEFNATSREVERKLASI